MRSRTCVAIGPRAFTKANARSVVATRRRAKAIRSGSYVSSSDVGDSQSKQNYGSVPSMTVHQIRRHEVAYFASAGVI